MSQHISRSAVLLFSCVAILFGGLSGCAGPVTKRQTLSKEQIQREEEKQKDVTLQTYVKRFKHLNEVAWPISRVNTELCGDKVKYAYGVAIGTRHDLPKDFHSSASRLYHFDDHPRVLYTLSHASGSRLQPGDRILEINGIKPSQGKNAAKSIVEALDKANGIATYKVDTVSGGTREVTIRGSRLCDYPVVLLHDDSVNAAADGKNVIITMGMYRFADNDTDLATVIGHELAHNIMGHLDKRRTNQMGGLVVDILAAAMGVNTQGAFTEAAGKVYSQEFESEADYVGLYLVARTGMDIDAAPTFWRRLAAEHPGSIKSNHAATHPATPERFLALESTVREIDNKREMRVALLPTLDEGARISSGDASGAIHSLTESGSSDTSDAEFDDQPLISESRADKNAQSGQWTMAAEFSADANNCRDGLTLLSAEPSGAEMYEAACSNGTTLQMECLKHGCVIK